MACCASAVTDPGRTPMRLEVRDLTCRFGAAMVVSGVSLSVAPGEHVAVIGGNGSGKTTLLRAVMGLHRDRSGEILADGQALPPAPPIPHPRMVWMPQRQPRGQFPFTVRELLASGPNEPASRDTADRLGIGGLLHRPLSALSGGQLQRAFLARALGGLAGGGGLLLADEPTAALDFQGQEQVADMLAALPATMLVVTHDLTLARKCGRVLQMAQGSIREFVL